MQDKVAHRSSTFRSSLKRRRRNSFSSFVQNHCRGIAAVFFTTNSCIVGRCRYFNSMFFEAELGGGKCTCQHRLGLHQFKFDLQLFCSLHRPLYHPRSPNSSLTLGPSDYVAFGMPDSPSPPLYIDRWIHLRL